MEGLFFILFFLVIGMFIITIIRNIGEWVNNNNSPCLSVPASVVAKRRTTHHHHSNGHHHHTHSYYVTFQVESGDRMELKVRRSVCVQLIEGDAGTLSVQGTRYLGFEKF